ncbi:MAG: regulatory protein RecX [Microbacterium sp.]|uniref:regulatory protein RecX n=1 Tax=Microbacterium sp. TaxID=51671 RepID=UPI0039E680D4
MVRFVEDEERPGGAAAGLAPVIPLFGGRDQSRGDDALTVAQRRHPAGSARPDATPAHAAEHALLRKLAARSLSIVEARAVLAGFTLTPGEADGILSRCEERGYLDDAALAEQIVHVALDRRGEGRRAIAVTLAKRGVPREVAAAALAELPDDDRERALSFARTRARALRGLDRDVALRRLVGQLARRGYPGHVAMDAARAALAETG